LYFRTEGVCNLSGEVGIWICVVQGDSVNLYTMQEAMGLCCSESWYAC